MKFKINCVIYFCKNMKLMTEFYTNVMGLRVIRNDTFPPNEWLELGGKGFKLCLHKAGNPGCPGRNRNKLVFEVDEVGEARAYLVARKVRVGKNLRWASGETCDGRDPEGNRFQIAGPRRS